MRQHMQEANLQAEFSENRHLKHLIQVHSERARIASYGLIALSLVVVFFTLTPVL